MKAISDNIKPILALTIVLLGFSYFFTCLLMQVKGDPQVTIAIVGVMGTAAGYYFGSSTGTAKKDETIQELSKQQK